MIYSFYRSLFLLLFVVFFVSCGNEKSTSGQQANPAVDVNVATVESAPAVYYDNYPATVTPVNEVEIRPQISGYITGIFFKEGQHVTKGEKLYQIDQQQYRGAYEQALAQLSASEANLAKSQQDADRYQELEKQDAIAKQTVDHALADLEAARKQVDAAKANVSAVETNLRYSTLYAPFSGTIGISQVRLGASVSPGSTVLNTISSEDPIAVDVALSENYIPMLVELQKSKPSKTDSTFTLQLSDQRRYAHPGQIYIIDRAVDPQTGTIKLRLIFPNPERYLKAGMTCNVLIRNNSAGNSILIPFKCVLEQMGEFFVFVVKDNKVHQQKVIPGRRIGDKVIIKDGLAANETIVTDGVQKLKDGSAVNVGGSAESGKASKASSPDSTKEK
jgi:membrane fusion protein (multidrug efflux system)